ncbi:uncharacterized protein LOC124919325 [Impatiens glandulifera]|uniref:uncharacterized protein LOC124919325 n=1 Tax=Impatiens glandulifera TaxID=253017 RepID=UPI001FB08967|nr:uncharacterized protein LOC124919325 [Impatiens glandulifera]
MGFASFLGRLLFASIFILSARQMYNDLGTNDSPSAQQFAPKLAVLQGFLNTKFGDEAIQIDVNLLVAAAIVLKGLGGFLFVFGSTFGAYLMVYYLAFTTPVLFDFYKYSYGGDKFNYLLEEFMQGLALLGALLFFLGMKNSLPSKQLKKRIPKAKTT